MLLLLLRWFPTDVKTTDAIVQIKPAKQKNKGKTITNISSKFLNWAEEENKPMQILSGGEKMLKKIQQTPATGLPLVLLL